MERVVVLALSGALVFSAACTSTAVTPVVPAPTVETVTMDGHFMNVQYPTTGIPPYNVPMARLQSGTSQVLTVDITKRDGNAATGTIAVGGIVPADSTNVPVDQNTVGDRLPTFRNSDVFLGEVVEGKNFALSRYNYDWKSDIVVRSGYVVFGDRTKSVPTAGTASYNGEVYGMTIANGEKYVRGLTGSVNLNASFGGTPAIGGKMTNLRLHEANNSQVPLAQDIVMEPVGLNGSGYAGGKMHLIEAGSVNTRVGTMIVSDYQGALYGAGGPETAGTFQFLVRTDDGAGGTVDRTAIGGFAASQ